MSGTRLSVFIACACHGAGTDDHIAHLEPLPFGGRPVFDEGRAAL